MRHIRIRVLATAAVAALALAACGSSSKAASSTDTSAPATTTTTTVAAAPASVTLASTKLGMILVDTKGLSLYQFENDKTPGASTCGAGQCASTWPAAIVTTATPVVGSGITGKIATFKRADDGKLQLQINGHPLYTFAGDSKPGDVNGQKIIDKWYVTTGAGAKVGDTT